MIIKYQGDETISRATIYAKGYKGVLFYSDLVLLNIHENGRCMGFGIIRDGNLISVVGKYSRVEQEIRDYFLQAILK